jgi:hypothetical protein
MAGLQSIIDLRNRVNTFNDGLTSGLIIRDIIDDGMTTAFIIDANAEEQLFEQGINRLGVDIMDYRPYTPLTIAIKEEKGQPTNRVTLRDEGGNSHCPDGDYFKANQFMCVRLGRSNTSRTVKERAPFQ